MGKFSVFSRAQRFVEASGAGVPMHEQGRVPPSAKDQFVILPFTPLDLHHPPSLPKEKFCAAKDQGRAGCLRQIKLSGQLSLPVNVVVIEIGDPLARDCGESDIARGRGVRGLPCCNHPQASVAQPFRPRMRLDYGPALPVGIDHHHLKIRPLLREHRSDGPRQKRRPITRRQDDRNQSHGRDSGLRDGKHKPRRASEIATFGNLADALRVDASHRNGVIASLGVVLALLIGWDLAEGSFALAVLVAVLVLLLVVNRALNLAPDLWVTGLILVGYLIGNRGFAQLHPPNLPLLPAEFALGISVLFGLWRWARERRVPYRPDTLNACVLLWLVFATLRLPLDFRATGFVAIRDFAMVYYAVFFFLAQDWSQSGENRRFLERALIGGLALTTPAFWAFSLAPEWIERHIAIAGTPLLYVKSDVAGGFMAGAVFVFVERYSVRRRAAWILLASVSLAGVATSNSRAAGVALFAGLIWLVVLRRWAAIRIVAALIAIGIVGLVGQAVVTRAPLTTTPLYRGYEAVVSIGDIAKVEEKESGKTLRDIAEAA